jgi:hypothetical protein
MPISRRKFIQLSAAFGATLALRSRYEGASSFETTERREYDPGSPPAHVDAQTSRRS